MIKLGAIWLDIFKTDDTWHVCEVMGGMKSLLML